MRKSFIALVLCLALAISLMPAVLAAPGTPVPTNATGTVSQSEMETYRRHGSDKYVDVNIDDWFAWYVGFVDTAEYMNGVSTGTPTFAPADYLTRAMAVTVLSRVERYRLQNENMDLDNSVATEFSDVPTGQWYTGAIRWANTTSPKIVEGRGESIFDPNGNITRQEAAAIIYRYLQQREVEFTNLNDPQIPFLDQSSIASWAEEAVKACVKYGIIDGYPDEDAPEDLTRRTFKPLQTITRAEFAKMITQLHLILHLPTPPEPTPVAPGGYIPYWPSVSPTPTPVVAQSVKYHVQVELDMQDEDGNSLFKKYIGYGGPLMLSTAKGAGKFYSYTADAATPDDPNPVDLQQVVADLLKDGKTERIKYGLARLINYLDGYELPYQGYTLTLHVTDGENPIDDDDVDVDTVFYISADMLLTADKFIDAFVAGDDATAAEKAEEVEILKQIDAGTLEITTSNKDDADALLADLARAKALTEEELEEKIQSHFSDNKAVQELLEGLSMSDIKDMIDDYYSSLDDALKAYESAELSAEEAEESEDTGAAEETGTANGHTVSYDVNQILNLISYDEAVPGDAKAGVYKDGTLYYYGIYNKVLQKYLQLDSKLPQRDLEDDLKAIFKTVEPRNFYEADGEQVKVKSAEEIYAQAETALTQLTAYWKKAGYTDAEYYKKFVDPNNIVGTNGRIEDFGFYVDPGDTENLKTATAILGDSNGTKARTYAFGETAKEAKDAGVSGKGFESYFNLIDAYEAVSERVDRSLPEQLLNKIVGKRVIVTMTVVPDEDTAVVPTPTPTPTQTVAPTPTATPTETPAETEEPVDDVISTRTVAAMQGMNESYKNKDTDSSLVDLKNVYNEADVIVRELVDSIMDTVDEIMASYDTETARDSTFELTKTYIDDNWSAEMDAVKNQYYNVLTSAQRRSAQDVISEIAADAPVKSITEIRNLFGV